MGLTAIVTNAGRAALVNAANTGTRAVTIARVGLTGSAVTPEAGATVLPGQFKTIATLSGDVVADDTIHLIVRDESADVFTVRSLALYLDDGTLFAIYGQADVLIEKSAQALMLLAIDIRFEDVNAATITFGDTTFLNPPATTERQGVVELATVAEAQAGIDALRALTPQAARSAILGWLLAQDGAGSGLDADLLDGQQGSYYTDIAARLGYVPWGPANDGAGSGLDADLLDGLDSSYFVNIPARLGFYPVQMGTGFGQLPNVVKIGWSGTRLKATVDVTDQGNLVTDTWLGNGALQISGSALYRSGLAVWGPDNDGAGSGLDADLLDGMDSSYYTDIVSRLGYTPARGLGSLGNADLNTVTTSGMYRVETPTNGPDGVNFGQLLVVHGGGDTVTQIYSSFSDGTLWTRSGNPPSLGGGGGWSAWSSLVKAPNSSTYSAPDVIAKMLTVDGAGSGLDADLLDGRQASDFALLSGAQFHGNGNGVAESGDWVIFSLRNNQGSSRAVGNTSWESVNENGITVSSIQSWLDPDGKSTIALVTTPAGSRTDDRRQNAAYFRGPGRPTDLYGSGLFLNGNPIWRSDNDGAGSGLDADLLDGQQGSWYADIIGRLGYAPVQQGTGVGQQSNAIKMGWNGSKLQLTVDTYDQGNIVTEPNLANATLNVNAAYVQRNNNHLWGPDNDGAGSGLDADLLDGFQSDAFARITAQSIGSTGYMALSNGLKIVYGTVPLTQDAYSYASFPIAFENAPAVVFPTIDAVNNSSDQNTLLTARTMNGFTVFQAADISNVSLPYIAIGN